MGVLPARLHSHDPCKHQPVEVLVHARLFVVDHVVHHLHESRQLQTNVLDPGLNHIHGRVVGGAHLSQYVVLLQTTVIEAPSRTSHDVLHVRVGRLKDVQAQVHQ